MAIAGYDGSARVALYEDFRENVQTTSLGIRVGSERYLNVSFLCKRVVYFLKRW